MCNVISELIQFESWKLPWQRCIAVRYFQNSNRFEHKGAVCHC